MVLAPAFGGFELVPFGVRSAVCRYESDQPSGSISVAETGDNMLRNITSLFGTSIRARDGGIGSLHDVLFDDHSWVVRYFVVETGRWRSGRRVLLSPFTFLEPKWDSRVMPVDLTIREVRRSPDVHTDLPVYRQQEFAMAQHYGWPAYWTMETAQPHKNEGEFGGDPNLRSTKQILTYRGIL